MKMVMCCKVEPVDILSWVGSWICLKYLQSANQVCVVNKLLSRSSKRRLELTLQIFYSRHLLLSPYHNQKETTTTCSHTSTSDTAKNH